MPIRVVNQLGHPAIRLGIVELDQGAVRDASDALRLAASHLASVMTEPSFELAEDDRRAVRGMLKLGGFSPTGRSRPAQELLLRDLKERGGFHHINNIVDACNLVSLEAAVPISVFDASKLGDELHVRLGRDGEGFVFNPSGQRIDVKRCIVCCRDDEPIGSPVKDGLETKVFEGASHYVAVLYVPSALLHRQVVANSVERLAQLLVAETCGRLLRSVML